ncbi:SRPBCC family protein [Streptomonospora wellingtoniae]|uniref:SRPBCC family protein n=1 Tax=Streptomonospora wellingtoniae TaxID=3075544 RepID=A0ABU2KTY6_9ACTN|nr:SRPBCC family protein [Streptomonospora sp. DSM 45055]MDT0302759.1 SRPBCC family protein [Streptomonospora sp. DSM 45055]
MHTGDDSRDPRTAGAAGGTDRGPRADRQADAEEAYGRLAQAGERWTVRLVRRLPHPPEKVWRAITEPEHLAAWFPSRIEGPREAGAELRFHFEGVDEPMPGRMIVYDPPRLLEFDWAGDMLRFELRPDGAGTELVFSDTFDELGKAARDTTGWHVCLDALAAHLEGEPPRFAGRFRALMDDYTARFGPEAGTIGPPEGAQPD